MLEAPSFRTMFAIYSDFGSVTRAANPFSKGKFSLCLKEPEAEAHFAPS